MNIIISEREPSMKKVAESRANNTFRQVQPLSQDHEYALVKLLEQEIELARKVDSICKDISLKNENSFYDIYCSFDIQKLNYITHEAYLLI